MHILQAILLLIHREQQSTLQNCSQQHNEISKNNV